MPINKHTLLAIHSLSSLLFQEEGLRAWYSNFVFGTTTFNGTIYSHSKEIPVGIITIPSQIKITQK